ncbi:radical SAM protein [Candidatus Woesearchaeota archaeon]|nr:radical SAM protein [Candidatus Woesearchaeota archaeon]
MKILLVNLPWIDDTEFSALRAGSRWPHLRMKREQLPYYPFPFFLAYAAAVLKQNNHDVYLKDCVAERLNQYGFLKYLEEVKPEMVVMETSTPSIENDLAWAKKIKEIGCITVMTGPHATAVPLEVLKEPYVDYVLPGEIDYSLRDLSNTLRDKKNVHALSGVHSKMPNGDMVMNKPAPLITDLDGLPYPYREGLPMENYIDPACKHAPGIQMIASRGCPNQCIYCYESQNFYGRPNYRVRSVKNVADEMEHLIKTYKVREIYFDDALFSVSQQRVIELCDEILKRKMNIYWSAMCDAKLKIETLRKMKESGCVMIKFGVESANREILKNIRKHITPEDVIAIVRNCREIGIETHATYMFGLPGETKETIKETMNFAFNIAPADTAQFAAAIPNPGTKFYEDAKRNGWLVTTDYKKYAGQDVVVQYEGLSAEDIYRAVHRARKKIMLKVAMNPRQFFQYVKIMYGYGGMKGVADNLYGKLSYLFSSNSRPA